MKRVAKVDLTSGGSPTYVLGPEPPAPGGAQSDGDALALLASRLEQHTGLAVVAVTATAAEARPRALELARALTGRMNAVACRGTEAEPGTRLVSHGDTLQALRAFEQDRPAAFVVEVVQASSGACVPPPKYLQRLRAGCDAAGVKLVVDETTAGLGRTGSLLAVGREKVTPDLAALSLRVAAGIEGGLVLARPELGVPAALASCPAAPAALAVLDALVRDRLVDRAKATGQQLKEGLHRILETRRRWAMDTRGRGLLHALSLWDDPALVIAAAEPRGLALARTGENGLLFAPPLTASAEDVAETLAVLDEVLAAL